MIGCDGVCRRWFHFKYITYIFFLLSIISFKNSVLLDVDGLRRLKERPVNIIALVVLRLSPGRRNKGKT